MLTYYAIKLTNQIYKHCSLSSEKRSIYVYGFELFLSTMLSVVSVLLFALFFSAPETGLIFLFVFMGLRLFSGGYHAKTYGHCFILTNAIFLLVLFCSWELVRAATETAAVIIAIILTFLSYLIIFTLAPIRNKNHPLSEERYARNKIIARIVVSAYSIVFIMLMFINILSLNLIAGTFTLTAVAVMMIIPKIQERSTL